MLIDRDSSLSTAGRCLRTQLFAFGLCPSGKYGKTIMTTLESLSKALLEESRQIDWRCLVLENLREFATLVWYFVADSQSVECVIPRMLKSLGSVPFDPSQPLLTYNEARTMVITHAIEAVQINSPQWGSVLITKEDRSGPTS